MRVDTMEAIRTQKIADVIATHIEKLILEGALRPGEKLAPERELAQKLDVSRPSLRDAIEKLAERGLLTATRGGTYVAQFLSPMMKPLANLYRDNQNAPPTISSFGSASRLRRRAPRRCGPPTSTKRPSAPALRKCARRTRSRIRRRRRRPTSTFTSSSTRRDTTWSLLHVMRAL